MEPTRKMKKSWGQAGGKMGWHKWFALWVGRNHRNLPFKKKKKKREKGQKPVDV